MPTQEQDQHPQPEPAALDAMPVPAAAQAEHNEQRYKTLAVRVEEGPHAQLQFIAQLSGTTLADEIRNSIQRRITTAQEDPELIARAAAVREQIAREAAARAAAIAGFMGSAAVTNDSTEAQPSGSRRGKTN